MVIKKRRLSLWNIITPPKKAFNSELNLEDITDKDYAHAQKVWEVFGIRNLGEYHDLNVQCDTLLLADVFEKFRDTWIEVYGLDPSLICSWISMAIKILVFIKIYHFYQKEKNLKN